MILMGAGYLVGWQATNLTLVWVMIILVAVGTGLFKGNLSGVNSLKMCIRDSIMGVKLNREACRFF